ncbi:MAG: CRISPR system precrRNA processing endoribonuclease RAMP protein Cas6 [Caldilineaceae bacterium]|nr:CRISPR system precrRNA processing endoribonuclease RAMP protein Cas6 [Caldilineaceae bacterium]
MLVSLLLSLRACGDACLPGHLGRANYAEVLTQIQRVAPDVSAQIHAGNHGPKPLTCSGLWGARTTRQGAEIKQDQVYTLRVTGLTVQVARSLHLALVETPPAIWTLAEHPFEPAGVTCDPQEHEWAGQTTYEELASYGLLQPGPPTSHVTLQFGSPTSFKSAGIHVPVPLPDLVFGSLVERWNAFSPITLSPEMRRFGEEMIAISRYNLRSQAVHGKQGGLRIGGVGEVTYTALNRDRYWCALMQMLADFALYSGVGVQTTMGMGQARRIG